MNERIPDQKKLHEDLTQILGETPEPSAELRAAIMEYGAQRRRRTPAPRWRIPAAAATLVAAAALVILVTRPDAPRIESMLDADRMVAAPAMEAPVADAPAARAPMEKALMSAAPVAGDLNQDGQVNILDAWRLARAIEQGKGQGDLDADGEVSPDDLDQLMQQIVAVGGGAS